MSYKALLFCSDASSARVITQVLSELGVQCESLDEPFAAVKKLTSERLDATVIDCSNEQDAALLVKSARNSSFNQQALFVAVVEGKSGVANAFRLGANLVLTKPVSVEQAKSTLRMVRGLLHKNEAAKSSAPATLPASTPESVMTKTAGPATPKPPAVPSTPWAPPSVVVAAPPASILEVEKEPTPALEAAEAGVLESIPEPTSSKPVPSAWPAIAAHKESPPVEAPEPPRPIASTLLEAEDNASETETNVMAPDSSSVSTRVAESVPSKPFTFHSVGASVGTGQSAAAAPARAPAPATYDRSEESTTGPEQHPAPATINLFAEQKLESTNSKKWLAIAAVALAVAVAGYVGWTKLQSHTSGAVGQQNGSSSPSTPVSQAVTTPTPAESINTASPQAPNTPPPASTPVSKLTAPAPKAVVPTAAPTASQEVLMVSNQPAKPISPPQPPAESTPAAPPSMDVASSSGDQTAPSMLTAASAPTPALQDTRVSQGVAQGLLIKRVQPVYPAQALSMHIQGAVELLATISKDGNVTNLKQLSGDAMLGRAAMDAVKQWKYRSYLLNGQPLEIQTQITVNFKAP